LNLPPKEGTDAGKELKNKQNKSADSVIYFPFGESFETI
jgi:hypothetical protein